MASKASIREVSGTVHTLDQIHWQYFVTIGLHNGKDIPVQKAKNIWGGFRGRLAKATGIKPKRLIWAVVLEWGKSGQNPHLHALISGLPRDINSASITQAMVLTGRKMMTPNVFVKVYDNSLGAVAYIHKELRPYMGALRKDDDCWPMISDSVWRVLQRHPNRR